MKIYSNFSGDSSDSWSGSNEKLTSCYAYLTEIWCVGSQQFGQPLVWLDMMKQFLYSYNDLEEL